MSPSSSQSSTSHRSAMSVVLCFALSGGGIFLVFAVDLRLIVCDAYSSSSSLLSSANHTSSNNAWSYQRAEQRSQEFYYNGSFAERYILEHAAELGFDTVGLEGLKPSCTSLTSPESPIYTEVQAYRQWLEAYDQALQNVTNMPDLREQLWDNPELSQATLCVESFSKHLFEESSYSGGNSSTHTSASKNNRHSLLSYSSKFGYVEPLLPPLRHVDFCFELKDSLRQEYYQGGHSKYLMHMGYLVHDFGAMCRKLTPKSRIVLLDLGASLEFHNTPNETIPVDQITPAIYLTQLYRQFGFHFDHVYGFEVTEIAAHKVYEQLPTHLIPAYHWINTGVTSNSSDDRFNPFASILQHYNEDDLIIVKLDIDTHDIEKPLAQQLLNTPRFAELIDHFYYEDHVWLYELHLPWGGSMGNSSVRNSLELFAALREKGIAAHYWP